MAVKEMKTTILSYDEYSQMIDPPSTFFIRDAVGQYVFIHTSSRVKAQACVDEEYGKGKYTVIASRLQKTKSKLESGGLSCTGTATRKGQKAPN